MNANTNINIRTTSEIKANANEVLKALGLDISRAEKNEISFGHTYNYVERSDSAKTLESKKIYLS